MIVVTPKFALIFFIFIIFISLVVTMIFQDFNQFHEGRCHTFVAVLAGLGIFITFMFYYGVVSLQQQQQQLFVIQETARLSNLLIDGTLSEINKATSVIPKFCYSLMPLIVCQTDPKEDPNTPEACMQRMVLSYKIFSSWQDLIIANSFIDYDPEAYITNFLQRANSKHLFTQWIDQKINFNKKTQDFGTLLFKYGLPITDQIPSSYVTAAESLISDPQYQQLLTM